MKGVITIFALPQELEDLALTLNMLKRNSIYLDNSVKYQVDITMCLSDELTNWSETKLPKEYIKERTTELVTKFLDWCNWDLMWGDNKGILGCVSQRRYSLTTHQDANFFIWLDCDFIFKDTTLYYITQSYQNIKSNNIELFILTPQFVKQWDNTWDVVVNDRFLSHQIDYELVADIYKDTLPDVGEIEIKPLSTFKFAGGWFTLITKDLLEKTDIPESLGHYGLEDTYITECCKILKNQNQQVFQFVLENHIIGESYIHRPNETVKKYISNINKKEEYTKIAHNNFVTEINNFYERSNSSTNSLQ
jgi:hypothetical protein